MILRVGLTGGIASGKSTVARIFTELGCHVYDADLIVRELYDRGAAGYVAIVERYGDRVLDASGAIDREALARIAFATAESAAELNSLIHPLVLREEDRRLALLGSELQGRDAIAVVEATLLIESGGRQRYERIVVVDVDPTTQLRRAVIRGMNEKEAKRRIARQLSREERLSHADYVIVNDGDLKELHRSTEFVHRRLLRDLEQRI